MNADYREWSLADLYLEVAKRKLAHGITEQSFPDPEQRRARLVHILERDDQLLHRYPEVQRYPDFGRRQVASLLILFVWIILSAGASMGQSNPVDQPVPVVFGSSITITDGDTLKIGDIRVRLHGIDAPEKEQTCEVDAKPPSAPIAYPCGTDATNALKGLIGSHTLFCAVLDVDYFGRLISRCHVGSPYGPDLSRSMIAMGWAIAYRQYSKDYTADEEIAKNARLGIWRGPFQNPAVWRKEH